ncbi:MAG: helix-turn-helix transcriptional regulator [Clostridia bacterium]|jgi:transcriptional regulator with XRE-family HTH domain|nr:helix-turn-helix transcriptional regulator [Clostridia bacterium]
MIGERLKEIRRDAKDRQSDLAEKLNVSVQTIKSWEGEKSSPGHDFLVQICRLYNVSADYLLGLTDDDPFLRQRNNDLLTPENQRFLHKLENLLLLDQQRQTKK